MFGTVLTVAFALLLAYVIWRAASVPVIAGLLPRKRLVVLGVVVWVVFFLGRFFGHEGTGPVASALESAGMTLLGWVFLVFITVFIVDLATVFGRVLSSWAPRLRGWGFAAGTVLCFVALVQGHRAPEAVFHEVTLSGLPIELDETVIVAVSDTHIGSQLEGRWLADRAAQIQSLRPDVVVFLGDIFEGHGKVPGDVSGLRRLSARLGKWYVEGNHESHGDGKNSYLHLMKRSGFRRLANRSVEIAPGLILAGVKDLTRHYRRNLGGDPMGEALEQRPAGATVLLSHTPWHAERAASRGVGLMLSGHTHDGQIWPFGYLVQARYPLLAGRYEVDGMTAIVSRGAGTWGPRMRLWRRGEILVITLRSSSIRQS